MNKKTTGVLKDLLSTTLKIGLIGFGGGSALIPIIQENMVEDKHLVEPDEYEEDVMIASVTPGALPVEISGCIGKRVAGWRGMLVGAMGMAFPGVFLTLLLLSLMAYVDESVLRQIQFVAVGITAFIACLLTDYVRGTIKKKEKGQGWKSIIAVCLVFGLTCGKNLYRILGIEGKPLIALSNIQIFALAFLVLFVVHGVQFVIRLCRMQRKKEGESTKRKMHLQRTGVKEMQKELLALLIVLLVTGLVAFLVTNQSLPYLWNGFLSSVMSFGGGDAYLTVAEGLFVDTAIIAEDDFYGNLVPLVNVLPGSILCKTFSGIGFYLGLNQTGNLLGAYVVAAAGFACSIFASCGVVSIGGCFYKSFEDLALFQTIRSWIRPIVAGLMLNVILALFYQNCKLGNTQCMGLFPAIMMIAIYILDTYLYHVKRIGNGKIVLISIVISVIFCNCVSVLL